MAGEDHLVTHEPAANSAQVLHFPCSLNAWRVNLQGSSTMATMIDPVCGMEVEADNAGEHVSYGMIVYYFCSAECREKFEADPARYVTDLEGKRQVDTAAIPEDQQSHEAASGRETSQ